MLLPIDKLEICGSFCLFIHFFRAVFASWSIFRDALFIYIHIHSIIIVIFVAALSMGSISPNVKHQAWCNTGIIREKTLFVQRINQKKCNCNIYLCFRLSWIIEDRALFNGKALWSRWPKKKSDNHLDHVRTLVS